MKLFEALARSPLSAGTVVSGGDHLDREISWVQVVDHPDISSWVKDGHLLLSTGYNWPKDEAAAGAVVEQLSNKGICGVVLAVPHFLNHFPRASIEAAERVGLPLIEIPWEVPFSEITLAVHRELVDQQGQALIRSEQIHRELTEAAVSGSSLNDVARVLASVLGRSVDITSADGLTLGTHEQSDAAGVSTRARLDEAFGTLEAAGEIEQVRMATRPTRIVTLGEGRGYVGYAARVRTECVGFVFVDEGTEQLSALDLRAIEHAGTVAALQISHQRELSTQEARLGYALVASLIEGRFEDKPQSMERAKLLGWDSKTRYRLCAILLDEPNPLSREGFEKREQVATMASRSLQHKGIRPIVSLTANQVQLLVPETLDVGAWWSELPAARLAMGVSQVNSGIDGMKQAGVEAAELVDHLKPGRVHHYDELLFPRVLRGDVAAQEKFLTRLFGPLREGKRSTALLDTALALAEEGFHLQRAATRLGVHISTLRYRLDGLSAATGLDLETVEGRLRLQVAARLLLMRNE